MKKLEEKVLETFPQDGPSVPKKLSEPLLKLEKAITMYTENLFDNRSFPNVLARSYTPFFAKDKDFKSKAQELTAEMKTEVAAKMRQLIEDMKIKERLIELENIPVRTEMEGWEPSGEPEVDIKAFRYAAKLKFLAEMEEPVEVKYVQVQNEYTEQLAIYQAKKAKLKQFSDKQRLQLEEYDEKIGEMKKIIPAEL